MKQRLVLATLGLLTVAGGLVLAAPWTTEPPPPRPMAVSMGTTASDDSGRSATLWRDPGCGCCDAYGEYLEANGYQVTLVDDRDFAERSIAVGVPERGIGCHLAEIDGYFVSGLVPVEIIERLVTERPDIAGITLPGMPPNAPGMAPEKSGTLKTYAFGDAGVTVYSDE